MRYFPVPFLSLEDEELIFLGECTASFMSHTPPGHLLSLQNQHSENPKEPHLHTLPPCCEKAVLILSGRHVGSKAHPEGPLGHQPSEGPYQEHEEDEEDIGDEVHRAQDSVGIVDGFVVKIPKDYPELGESER